jgi:hypothetical protein
LNDINYPYLMNVLEQSLMNTKPRPQNFISNCNVTINYNYNKSWVNVNFDLKEGKLTIFCALFCHGFLQLKVKQ